MDGPLCYASIGRLQFIYDLLKKDMPNVAQSYARDIHGIPGTRRDKHPTQEHA